MGLHERRVRVYVCDRCGDQREVEGSMPAPAGWKKIARGSAATGVDLDAWERATILCVDCVDWLNKFLSGRKVSD